MNHGEEDYYVEKIYEDTICFVTGKFKMLNNGSLELVLSSCKSLIIEKEKKYRSKSGKSWVALTSVQYSDGHFNTTTKALERCGMKHKLFGSQTRKRTR